MAELDTLRALDAEIAADLLAEGVASAAVYTPPGVDPDDTDCIVVIDRGVIAMGNDAGEIVGRQTHITFFAPAFVPVRGARVVIDADTWALDSPVSNDGSAFTWAASKVTA